MKTTMSPKMLEQMMASYKADGGGNEAIVVTAVDISKTDKDTVLKILQEKFGETLTSSFVTNPDILGGIRIEVGDWVYDGTLSRELGELVNTLTT